MSLLKSSQLVRILWDGRRILLIITTISLVLGLVLENFRTHSWKTVLPLVISSSGESKSTDFNYDHYYSYEASDNLTDSLEEWLKAPSTLDSAKVEANSSFKSSSWRFWERNNWSVKKKAPQLIEVSYYTDTEEGAKLTEKSLKNRVNDFLTSFNQTGEPYFYLTNSSSNVEFQAPNWILTTILSLLWGILIGIILILEKENLKQGKEKD